MTSALATLRNKFLRMRLTYGLALLLLGLVPILFGLFSIFPTREFYTVIITANIAMAIFSINLSISDFSLSRYKAAIAALPPSLMRGGTMIFLLGLSPLVILPFSSAIASALGISTLPAIAFCSFWLRRRISLEANPKEIVRNCAKSIASIQATSQAPKKSFWGIYKHELRNQEVPMHELDSDLTEVDLDNEDLDAMLRIFALALNENDQGTTRYVFQCFLGVARREILRNNTISLPARLALRGVQLSAEALCGSKERHTIHRICVKALAHFLIRQRAHFGDKAARYMLLFLLEGEKVSKHALRQGHSDSAVLVLTAARRLAWSGMQGKNPEAFLFEHNQLVSASLVANRIGEAAIEGGNSDLLYRCFDALGFLGCAAVKRDFLVLSARVLQTLSYLGRLSRARNLECFWESCSVLPWQHSAERIQWMLSWTSRKTLAEALSFKEMFGEALSRLYGKKCEVVFAEKDDKVALDLKIGSEDHVWGYLENSSSREVNYADFQFVKDLKLYE